MFIHTSTNTSVRQFVVFFFFFFSLIFIKNASISQYSTSVQCLKIYHLIVKFDTRINNSTWVNFSAVSKLKKEMFALQDKRSDNHCRSVKNFKRGFRDVNNYTDITQFCNRVPYLVIFITHSRRSFVRILLRRAFKWLFQPQRSHQLKLNKSLRLQKRKW